MRFYRHRKARVVATADQLRQIRELEKIASKGYQEPVPNFSKIVTRKEDKK